MKIAECEVCSGVGNITTTDDKKVETILPCNNCRKTGKIRLDPPEQRKIEIQEGVLYPKGNGSPIICFASMSSSNEQVKHCIERCSSFTIKTNDTQLKDFICCNAMNGMIIGELYYAEE